MSPQFQTVAALAIVAIAASALAWRSFAKKKKPGCGSDCACPTDELKAKIKR